MVYPVAGQVYLSYDCEVAFPDPGYPFCNECVTWNFDGPPPNETIVDIGPPHNHVAQVQVDSSNQESKWYGAWHVSPSPWLAPTVVYDPAHTFFKFDLLTSQLRPVCVIILYAEAGWFDVRELDLDVSPTATNSFQTFCLPLSAFTETIFSFGNTNIPPFPVGLEFRIIGDPANPATTWPSAADNVFMIDNLAYIIAPPLSIEPAGDNVVLSWPMNTNGFVLQQSSEAGGADWTTATNAPVLTNDVNQVSLPKVAAQGFYRLNLVPE